MIYATPADLALYLTGDAASTPPANAAVLLRRASGLVSESIRGAVYSTDADDLPTLPRLRTALLDATVEQAALWASNNIDPLKGRSQIKPAVKSKSLGSGSVTFAEDAAAAAALSDLASGDVLAPSALRILALAGLLTTTVMSKFGASAAVAEWPYDPTTGRFIGKYDLA